jgi:hypothetical protein
VVNDLSTDNIFPLEIIFDLAIEFFVCHQIPAATTFYKYIPSNEGIYPSLSKFLRLEVTKRIQAEQSGLTGMRITPKVHSKITFKVDDHG